MIRVNGGNKTEIRGYFYQNPIGGLILLFGSFAIMGMPPSGLFVSELLIFKALILQKHWFFLVAIALALIVIFYVLLRAIFKMLFYPSNPKHITNIKGKPIEYILQILLLCLSVYFGIFHNDILFNLIEAVIH